jgi:hypothetical protein
MIRLDRREVAVPDIHEIKLRQEALARARRPPLQSTPRTNAPDHAQRSIDECLAVIRASHSGARHPTYTAEAARARAIADRYGLDWAPIRQALIAAYESVLTSAEATQRRSSSTKGVLRWLEARSLACQ